MKCKDCYFWQPKSGHQRYDRCRYYRGEYRLIYADEDRRCKHFELRANGAPLPDPPAFYDPRFQDD